MSITAPYAGRARFLLCGSPPDGRAGPAAYRKTRGAHSSEQVSGIQIRSADPPPPKWGPCAPGPPRRSLALEQLEQAFQVLKFDRRARRLAQAFAQLLQDLAGALDVDLIRHFDPDTWIRPVGALWRPPERLEFAVVVVEPEARGHLVQHLLGHFTGALAQLLEGATFLLRGAVEIALAQGPLGPIHGFARAAELFGCIETEFAHAALQSAQHLA